MEKNKLYYGDNLEVLRQHIKDESVDLIACVARAPSPASVVPKAQSISSAMFQFRKPRCCSELIALENTLHQTKDPLRLFRPGGPSYREAKGGDV